MRLSKGLALAAFISFAIGCTKADTKPDHVNGSNGKNDEGIATFLVKSIEGKVHWDSDSRIETVVVNGKERENGWRYPRDAVYTFSACIMDRATRHDAVGHRFRVVRPQDNREVAEEDITPTRPNGCFTWLETIPFQFFVKQSRWVVVERDIIGTGVNVGRQRVRLALNPWTRNRRDGSNEIIYLRDEMVPKFKLVPPAQADAAFSGDLMGPEQLYIEDVKIQTVRSGESNTGTLLRMNISMDVKTRFQNADGGYEYRKLDYGDFEVKAHLLLTGAGDKMNESVILTSGSVEDRKNAKGDVEITGPGRVIDGKLMAHLNAWADPRIRQGNVRLAIKVIPVGEIGRAHV